MKVTVVQPEPSPPPEKWVTISMPLSEALRLARRLGGGLPHAVLIDEKHVVNPYYQQGNNVLEELRLALFEGGV